MRKRLEVWNLDTGELLWGSGGGPSVLAFSPGGFDPADPAKGGPVVAFGSKGSGLSMRNWGGGGSGLLKAFKHDAVPLAMVLLETASSSGASSDPSGDDAGKTGKKFRCIWAYSEGPGGAGTAQLLDDIVPPS